MLGRRRTPGLLPPDPRELPPPTAELDRQLLDELRRVGADLAQPRDTRFFLYFSTEDDADAAADALADDYDVTVAPREDDGQFERWRVVASCDMVVGEREIARVRKQLGDVAVRNWGSLGGWEAEVQL